MIDKSYIPFDIGAWVSDEGVECPVHGMIYGGLSIRVETRPGHVVVRRYCGACAMNVFDKNCFDPGATVDD